MTSGRRTKIGARLASLKRSARDQTSFVSLPVLRGISANGYSLFIVTIIQFATVPIFVGAVGVRSYGIWVLYTSLPSYLALSDLGVSAVASTEAISLVSENRHTEARGLMRGLWLTLLSLTILVLLLTTTYILIAPTLGLGSVMDQLPAQLVITIGAYTLLAVLCTVVEGSLRAAGRYPTGVIFLATLRLCEFLATACALWWTRELEFAALAMLGTRFIGLVAFTRLLQRKASEMSLGLRGARLDRIRSLLGKGVGYLAFPSGNAVCQQGMVSVTGFALGPILLAQLTVARTASNVIRQCTNAVNQGVLPELTMTLGRKDHHRAAALLKKSLQLDLLIAGSMGLALVLGGPSGIRFWTNGRIRVSRPILLAFACTVAADVPWLAFANGLVAVNRHSRLAWSYLMVGLLSVLLAAATVRAFGIVAVPLSLLLLDLVLTWPAHRMVRQLLGDTSAVSAQGVG